MSIEVKNITKLYGSQKALNNVSLAIKAGEVVGFLGPNGAGKSTMMKILTCFIPPSQGDAAVCGFDVMEQPDEVKKRIGYLPETNPLYPEMYVLEYLTFVARIHKIANPKQRCEEMIALTGLSPERNKRLGQLSKGYRQRVGLAGALLHDPEVLILDEPTSGLDPNQVEDIRELIRQAGKAKTVMLSTHIMQEVEAMCNRVIIIDHGVIVADDSVQALSQLGKDIQMVEVEFDKLVVQEQINKINGVIDASVISGNRWLITAGNESDVRQELFRFAVANHLTVLSMQKAQQKLERIFRELTGNKQ
ncbi:MAG TPA: gliding motility-associated ABC transporter ATP-binding subunit GldA [Bacteroidales bacterium]|nr:gliding motility-associated ABC transporter ATP-binding subunit GldA [Bacteroidales bacterium]